jgi:hypothetical protein
MPKDKLNRLNNSTTLTKKKIVAKGWVSQSEAARLRGVSPQAIGRLIKKGRFRTLQIAGKVLLNRREVLNYKAKPTGRPSK